MFLLLDESTEGDLNMHSSKGFIIIMVSEESHPGTSLQPDVVSVLCSVRLNPGKWKPKSNFPACEAQSVMGGKGRDSEHKQLVVRPR